LLHDDLYLFEKLLECSGKIIISLKKIHYSI
jgi:hypothetical protein